MAVFMTAILFLKFNWFFTEQLLLFFKNW